MLSSVPFLHLLFQNISWTKSMFGKTWSQPLIVQLGDWGVAWGSWIPAPLHRNASASSQLPSAQKPRIQCFSHFCPCHHLLKTPEPRGKSLFIISRSMDFIIKVTTPDLTNERKRWKSCPQSYYPIPLVSFWSAFLICIYLHNCNHNTAYVYFFSILNSPVLSSEGCKISLHAHQENNSIAWFHYSSSKLIIKEAIVYICLLHNCIIIDVLFSYSVCLRNLNRLGSTDDPFLCNYCPVLHELTCHIRLAVSQHSVPAALYSYLSLACLLR